MFYHSLDLDEITVSCLLSIKDELHNLVPAACER